MIVVVMDDEDENDNQFLSSPYAASLLLTLFFLLSSLFNSIDNPLFLPKVTENVLGFLKKLTDQFWHSESSSLLKFVNLIWRRVICRIKKASLFHSRSPKTKCSLINGCPSTCDVERLPLLTSFAFFGKQKREMLPFKSFFPLANAFEPHICIGVWERGKRRM